MDVFLKLTRLGPAVVYSMLGLLIEGVNIHIQNFYKRRSLKFLNISLILVNILNKFQICNKIKILHNKSKLWLNVQHVNYQWTLTLHLS